MDPMKTTPTANLVFGAHTPRGGSLGLGGFTGFGRSAKVRVRMYCVRGLNFKLVGRRDGLYGGMMGEKETLSYCTRDMKVRRETEV
jgi:hypothetical protein